MAHLGPVKIVEGYYNYKDHLIYPAILNFSNVNTRLKVCALRIDE